MPTTKERLDALESQVQQLTARPGVVMLADGSPPTPADVRKRYRIFNIINALGALSDQGDRAQLDIAALVSGGALNHNDRHAVLGADAFDENDQLRANTLFLTSSGILMRLRAVSSTVLRLEANSDNYIEIDRSTEQITFVVDGNAVWRNLGSATRSIFSLNVGSDADPPASARFSVVDSGRGALPFPSLTTTQRDAISTPATGLGIFNTTTGQYEFYDGTAWQVLAGTGFATTAQIADVAGTEAAGTSNKVARGDHVHAHQAGQHAFGGEMALFSEHDYVFVPDAAKGANITTGDAQGVLHHSGTQSETVIEWFIDAELAPTGADIIIQLEFGDTDDLDTVASWTEIDRDNLTANSKSIKFTSGFTSSSVTAKRLIRMNVDQIGSTVAGQDGSVRLRVRRTLYTA